jgi:sugar-phosphatase
MFSPIKAVIFDMDGVLIDSEPLWRKAMVIGFNKVGIEFTEDDCRKTTGMRFKEVVEIWLKHHKIEHITTQQLENDVLDILIALIESEGKAIEGVLDVFYYAKKANLKIGLATSSANRLMNAVLNKLQLQNHFDSVISAEHMTYGKPHPEVFLVCANNLQIKPNECIVLEDSVNGVIAGKAAQMKVIAIPDIEHKHLKQFGIANYHCQNMSEVLNLFKELI